MVLGSGIDIDVFIPIKVHGWPDLADGWRYQIPGLVDLGYRVVAPDMMGYGGTVRTNDPDFYHFVLSLLSLLDFGERMLFIMRSVSPALVNL